MEKAKMHFTKKTAIAIALLTVTVLAIGTLFVACDNNTNDGATAIVDTDKTYQTMEGFGASSAWTYQALGAIEDEEVKEQAMEMLYGDSGLKLDTFRYNIGGGGTEVSGYPDPLRGAESYFVAENFTGDYSVFKDADNYDFTRDEGVRELFELALSKGNIKRVVFFANSPHYTMTVSGKTHGAVEQQNNLKEECYEAFSDYLMVITDYLYENIICKYDENIEVIISPVNEPQWDWGGENATQEGCHYEPEELAKFYQQFYTTLNAYNAANGTSFEMDIFESGNYLTASVKNYLAEFKKYPFFDSITNISVHSYSADTEERIRNNFSKFMDENYPDLKVSVTEYCVMQGGIDSSIDMGLFSATVIMRDLTMIDAVCWNFWLSVSVYDYEDGLVNWNMNAADGEESLSAEKRYYAMGQFSKFVQRGSVRVDLSFASSVNSRDLEGAAFKNPDGTVTVVIINNSDASKVNFGSAYNVQETYTDAENNWKSNEYEKGADITIPAKSIATYVLSK